jgi:hypothetical protein
VTRARLSQRDLLDVCVVKTCPLGSVVPPSRRCAHVLARHGAEEERRGSSLPERRGELSPTQRTREEVLVRLPAARKQASRTWSHVDIETKGKFSFRLDTTKLREARLREGRSLRQSGRQIGDPHIHVRTQSAKDAGDQKRGEGPPRGDMASDRSTGGFVLHRRVIRSRASVGNSSYCAGRSPGFVPPPSWPPECVRWPREALPARRVGGGS